MSRTIKITEIDGRKIAVKGIGQAFFQDGYPISVAIEDCSKEGVEVSMLHVADECLKNGWNTKTILSKFSEDFADGGYKSKLDLVQLELFCKASYEDQREMIFQYLFGCSTDDVRTKKNTKPAEWLKHNYF